MARFSKNKLLWSAQVKATLKIYACRDKLGLEEKQWNQRPKSVQEADLID